ncbi:MAG: ribulokinase [Lentisphaeria bacterium]|nr:ribulokinase [Lentisphaeria bacterium]
MTDGRTLIGLDFGSDSVRAVLVREDGVLLAESVRGYPRWAEGKYCDASAHRFRQHPKDYLESMDDVVREVLRSGNPASVSGIAADTTGSTVCAVDREGTPLALLPAFSENPDAMFLLWKDHSAMEEAELIDAAAGRGEMDYRKYEGSVYSCEWFWSKILHVLRSDPRVADAAWSFTEHCDWIVGELAGNVRPETMRRSRCAAGHKAMWHPDWGGLPPEAFLRGIDPRLAGFRSRLYEKTQTADVPVGKISPKWAAKWGLSPDVTIGGSGFDCHFGAVGSAIRPGELVKVIGTSTCDILAVPDPGRCIEGICGQVDGSVIPGLTGIEAGQSAFGDVYAWFVRMLDYAGKTSLRQLEDDAARLSPAGRGVFAIDWFNGRRTPYANARLSGALLGLDLGTSAPEIYRALTESTVFGAKRIIDHLTSNGIDVHKVTAIGGISRKSPFLMQLCADVFGLPVQVSAADQACALGGAMFAAVAAGVHPDIRTAMEAMNAGTEYVCTPDPETARLYRTKYRRYLDWCSAVEKETLRHA